MKQPVDKNIKWYPIFVKKSGTLRNGCLRCFDLPCHKVASCSGGRTDTGICACGTNPVQRMIIAAAGNTVACLRDGTAGPAVGNG